MLQNNPMTTVNIESLVSNWEHRNSSFLKDLLLVLFLKGVVYAANSESLFTSKDLQETYDLWFVNNAFPPEAKYKRSRTFTLTVEKILIQSGITFTVERENGERKYYGLELKMKKHEQKNETLDSKNPPK